jgi:N-acyl-D-aspartate/D-glutamate deacylase
VTTIVLNADGGGPLDLEAQLVEAEATGLAVNIGANIGFNTAWTEVNGREDARPSSAQIEEIRGLIHAGLDAGAWGISAGLDYKPAYYARADEVVAILSQATHWRTLFTNHDRLTPESGYSSMVGMRETVEIGEATGLMPLITHMKIQGREQGTSEAVLAMMSDATGGGVPTAADAYPYLAGQTSLAALIIPGWAQAGGLDAMLDRFADPEQRARIVREADEALEARFGGPGGVFLPETQEELTDLMLEMGATSGGDAVVRILQRDVPSAILRFGSEEDLAAILSHPTTSIACDCDPAADRVGHPRGYGTFPRALGRYVRELGVLTWEEAVRKMTGLPAATIGMVDRGFVAPGMVADLVVFDPETVIDRATYEDPTAPSEGIDHVLISGVFALRDGAPTGAREGRALRRSIHMPARPFDLASDRRLGVEGRVSTASTSFHVTVALAHASGDPRATGTFRIEDESGAYDAVGVEFGVLQTTESWASFTGVVEHQGLERAVTVIFDSADPTQEDGGITLSMDVEGLGLTIGRLEPS